MSGVKRFEAHYLTEGVMGGKALACAEMVLASDYDRDTQAMRDELNACKSPPGGCGYWRESARLRETERDELRAQIEVMRADSDLYRQWFNAVQDLNPHYLERSDYQAAVRLLEALGQRVPSSVSDAALQAKP